jgi:hypothetical protein
VNASSYRWMLHRTGECSLNGRWRYKHIVPPFCRLLAHLQLINTMEALCDWTRSSTPGIRRLVLLTLGLGTHVCKLYSADHLGPFFKCFLQLGWRLTGVYSTLSECPLNVHWMFTECSLNIHWLFTECSLNVHWMFPEWALFTK